MQAIQNVSKEDKANTPVSSKTLVAATTPRPALQDDEGISAGNVTSFDHAIHFIQSRSMCHVIGRQHQSTITPAAAMVEGKELKSQPYLPAPHVGFCFLQLYDS